MLLAIFILPSLSATTELPMITQIINFSLIILSSDSFDCAFPLLSLPFMTSPSVILSYFISLFTVLVFIIW